MSGQIKTSSPAHDTVRLEERVRTLEDHRNRGKDQRGGIPAEISLALGSAYLRNGQLPEAEKAYGEAITANPKLGAAHNNIAFVYMKTGRYDEAEKELKVSGREAIEAFGIDKYNDACRRSVLKYTEEWQNYVTRQARWVDFEHDYKTMDLSYMESVMWAFKRLWDLGLVYEGHRVMPYSWAMQTPVSNHETRIDDATRPRQDPAITVAFRLDPRPGAPG